MKLKVVRTSLMIVFIVLFSINVIFLSSCTNVESLSESQKEAIIGTYVGEAGCVLVLREDGTLSYFYIINEGTYKSEWRYMNGKLSFSVGTSVAEATVKNDDTSKLLFVAKSGGWQPEEYTKISDECIEYSQEKYVDIINEYYPNYADYTPDKYDYLLVENNISATNENSSASENNKQDDGARKPLKVVAGYKSYIILYDDGTTSNTFLSGNDYIDVACGFTVNVGLKADGTVTVDSKHPRLNDPVKEWTNIVQISMDDAENVICGLKSDGTVVFDGKSETSKTVSTWRNIVFVTTDGFNVYGINSNGELLVSSYDESKKDDKRYIWSYVDWFDHRYKWLEVGGSMLFQYDDGTYKDEANLDVAKWTNIKEIHNGTGFAIALTNDGRILFENHSSEYTFDFTDWDGIISIDAGPDYVVGIKEDGTAIETGRYKSVYVWK